MLLTVMALCALPNGGEDADLEVAAPHDVSLAA
jgi:hypothetical protein